jgi:tRNA U34 5-methylaminomethyl-2-thiouridine-forming methyltransferase MnmC
MMQSRYSLVRVGGNAVSIHSQDYGETMHPAIGPVAEAEALYVQQLKIVQRIQEHSGEFVIWDVGLGAAANALTILRATRHIPAHIRLISFDNTLEPLRFALSHATELGYFAGYEAEVALLASGQSHVRFQNEKQTVDWHVHVADFPTLLANFLAVKQEITAVELAPPHIILFDAFSPAKNPAMWTAPLFANLFRVLNPHRPCSLSTYSRSRMFRISLLLAGFFVGAGHPTGQKEETTVAANELSLIDEPLGVKWLERAQISTSAEPLWEPVYRQAPLTAETFAKLRQHPQFQA